MTNPPAPKILSAAHIDAIVNFALVRLAAAPELASALPRTNQPQALGELLRAENVRSVESRFGNAGDVAPYTWRPHVGADVTAVEFLKLLACLEANSCEAPDFFETPAYLAIDALRRRGIRALEGYDTAAWEYPEPAKDTKPTHH